MWITPLQEPWHEPSSVVKSELSSIDGPHGPPRNKFLGKNLNVAGMFKSEGFMTSRHEPELMLGS